MLRIFLLFIIALYPMILPGDGEERAERGTTPKTGESPAIPQEILAEFIRPENNLKVRFAEDWSPLATKKVKGGSDFYDPLKYVRIIGDKVWATFGADLRVRTVTYVNYLLLDLEHQNNTSEQEYIRLTMDLHVGKNFRIFTDFEHAYVANRYQLIDGVRLIDNKNYDFGELFAEYTHSLDKDRACSLRVGRQYLYFGKLRLISSIDYANVPKPFDLIAFIYKQKDWEVFTFVSNVTHTKKYKWFDENSHQHIWGSYGTGIFPWTGGSIDVYWLGWARRQLNQIPPVPITYNSIPGYEHRESFGVRFFGPIKNTNWDYDFEATYQIGTFHGRIPNPTVPAGFTKRKMDINAYMLVGQIGYTFTKNRIKPRYFLEFNYATGDRQSGGTTLQTFCTPYPNGPYAQGGGNLGIPRMNCISLFPGVTFNLTPELLGLINYTWYWRQSIHDGVYTSAGAFFRPGNLSRARYLGSEPTCFFKYDMTKHVYAYLIYGHFFTGTFFVETDPINCKDVDYLEIGIHHYF